MLALLLLIFSSSSFVLFDCQAFANVSFWVTNEAQKESEDKTRHKLQKKKESVNSREIFVAPFGRFAVNDLLIILGKVEQLFILRSVRKWTKSLETKEKSER